MHGWECWGRCLGYLRVCSDPLDEEARDEKLGKLLHLANGCLDSDDLGVSHAAVVAIHHQVVVADLRLRRLS